jgi:HSP20 family protein
MALRGFEGPRWRDPASALDELRREIDGLLGTWGQAAPWGAGASLRSGVYPPVNLYETADGAVLTAELPGVREEDLEVSVQANRVSLRGQRAIAYPEDASAHRRERQVGGFHRTVVLPFDVDGDRVEASYRQGVLVLRLPKPDGQQRRRISVKST